MTRIPALLVTAAVLAGGGAASHASPRATDRVTGDIYVVSSAGGGLRALTATSDIEIQPALSPGGRQLAFMSNHLWVMGADGSNPRPIGKAAGERPQWSPADRSLVFTGENWDLCYPGPAQRCVVAELRQVKADGSAQQKVRYAAMHPVWSRDGKRLAFRQFVVGEPGAVGDLEVMWADGSHHRTLYRTQPSQPDGDGISALPTWSPDGTWIAFASDSRLYLVRPDGTRLHGLADGTYPVWSPRGGLIAFERKGGIWVMRPTGGRARRVSPNGHCPTWSPDGSKLAYLTEGSQTRLEVVRQDGRGRKVLAVAAGCYTYGWAEPSPPAWSHDGRKLYFSG